MWSAVCMVRRACVQLTFMPGVAPASAASRNSPGVSPLAASTMPCETPNFILRGARLATTTVRRPLSVGRVVGRLDAGEHGAGIRAEIERQLQQLVGAGDRLGLDDAGDAQVDALELVDGDLRGRRRRGRAGWHAPPAARATAGGAAGGSASKSASSIFASTRVIRCW